MRAVLIDPELQTFTEIQLETGSEREIQLVLGCADYVVDATISDFDDNFDAIVTGDNYETNAIDPRFWFQLDADHDPPTSCELAGLGLAIGVSMDGENFGETVELQISLDELRARVRFTQRKFPIR